MSRWERNMDMQYRNAQDGMAFTATLFMIMFILLTILLTIYEYWIAVGICMIFTAYYCWRLIQHRKNVVGIETHMYGRKVS